jgi:hypothetical protein
MHKIRLGHRGQLDRADGRAVVDQIPLGRHDGRRGGVQHCGQLAGGDGAQARSDEDDLLPTRCRAKATAPVRSGTGCTAIAGVKLLVYAGHRKL